MFLYDGSILMASFNLIALVTSCHLNHKGLSLHTDKSFSSSLELASRVITLIWSGELFY